MAPPVNMRTETVRDAAFKLRTAMTTLDAVADDLDRAATVAGIQSEVASARALSVEVREEVDLLQRLLETRATAIELADSGFSTGGAYLMAQIAALSSQLELSLGDDIGSHGTSAEVREYYIGRALERAGIDPNDWDPELGLDANNHNVELVYEYYADLYRSDPDGLWWAGMAAVIGPSFFGGFRDLEMFADMFETSADIVDKLKYVPGNNPISSELAELSADQLANEFRWYQTRLLSMQQEIFFDMATAHEAYRDGGMLAIERLYEQDPYGFGSQTIGAWSEIDAGRASGDTALIASGNATLLLREQKYVIDNDYKEMLNRPVTGEAMTYIMTAIGAPSVPGALSYPEYNPLEIEASQYVGTPREVPVIPFLWDQSVPHAGVEATVTVTTPLPAGNIARLDDRWALIEDDTLPVWTDLAENHQGDVLESLETPVGVRAEQYETGLDDIAEWATSGWDIDFDLEAQAGW